MSSFLTFMTVAIAVLASLAAVPAFATSTAVAARQFPLERLPIAAHVKVPAGPGWLGIGFGSVWVSKSESRQVLRIDPVRNCIVATIGVGRDPELGIGIGLGSVWIPDPKEGTVTQISPVKNRVVRVLKVPLAADPEGSIGVGAGSLWVMTNNGGTDSGTLTRIDARSGRFITDVPVQPQSHAVLFAYGAVWVTSSARHVLLRVDPASNRVTDTIDVAPESRFMAAGDGSIWTLSQGDGRLTRIDPRTRHVIATIALEVPGEGGDLDVGEGSVWASAEGTPVSQVDPVRNVLLHQVVGGRKDDTLRVGFGSAWVISELDGDLWRISVDALTQLPVAP